MLGLPQRKYVNPLFEDALPGEAKALRPDVPYVVGSPSGGSLPFTVDAGVGHYYGVGAYLRSLEDARRANVRFASNAWPSPTCPRTSRVPRSMAAIPAVHDPRWKARVPAMPAPAGISRTCATTICELVRRQRSLPALRGRRTLSGPFAGRHR